MQQAHQHLFQHLCHLYLSIPVVERASFSPACGHWGLSSSAPFGATLPVIPSPGLDAAPPLAQSQRGLIAMDLEQDWKKYEVEEYDFLVA